MNERRQSQSPDSSRKPPGSACAECRRRKLRCDGAQPQCENCFMSGASCVVTPPTARRGPKKGHIKTLQARIANLESRLNGAASGEIPEEVAGNDSDHQLFQPLEDIHLPAPVFISPADLPMPPITSPDLGPLNAMPPWDISVTLPGVEISDLIKDDLDQLFFDRVYIFAPMLHRSRYLAWSRGPSKSPVRQGLQYAMWAMAASMSAQLEHLRDFLYQQAVQMLESPDARDLEAGADGCCQLENVQAWLMVAFYEFSRLTYDRGWMSAGKCFRLVQLLHLHEVDRSERADTSADLVPDETEEKRRVFWAAYVLDRLISIRADHPLTFFEPLIVTRLPASEDAFQTRHVAEPSGFLSDIFASQETQARSATHDCIILATLCGRTLSHRQQTAAEHSCDGLSDAFLERHQSLDALLTRTARSIEKASEFSAGKYQNEPMSLFNTIVAQAAVLHHRWTLETVVGQSDTTFQPMVLQCRQQALSSALELVRLARLVSQLSYFKIHPFMPLPLILCAEFLRMHQATDPSASLPLQEILRILEGLTSISNFRQAWKIEL
ncbi:hypothetical protein BJY01DRAFT_246604 [Aspergillus pseudoustus]|uniref:Zn(2)-C6 fungal-type domain-containing protein n=1 Tax=Aspergillus pseudoustus TaxID=1810923 RepID=A0ABR4K697_9EURO